MTELWSAKAGNLWKWENFEENEIKGILASQLTEALHIKVQTH